MLIGHDPFSILWKSRTELRTSQIPFGFSAGSSSEMRVVLLLNLGFSVMEMVRSLGPSVEDFYEE